MVQARDGNFYGTAEGGGANNVGTVFKMTPSGTVTTLHSFNENGPDGCVPLAALVQGRDGTFYGTTAECGANGSGTVFRLVLPRACVICASPE